MANRSSVLAASIKPLPIEVRAGRRSFTIPPAPASDWIEAVRADEPVTAVVPGMFGQRDFDRLSDLVMDERISTTDLRSMAFGAISEASGFQWWEAFNLVGLGDRDPIIVGLLTLSGVDPSAIPFGRWCSAVYALCIKDLDEKERQKWLARFTMPPPLAIEMDEDATGDSFEDMVRGFRGMPGARIS